MKKKTLLIPLVLLLALSLVVTGCPAQAPVDPERPVTHVSIAAGRPGDTWFVLSHALATFINERSDWLTADVVATAGIADNSRLVAFGPPEMRENHIVVTMLPGMRVWGAEVDYTPLKIGSLTFLTSVWVTHDPTIRTLEDMYGLAITLPRDIPQAYTWIFVELLEQAGVPYDAFTPMHGGLGAGLTALMDGAAHAGVQMIDHIWPDHFALGSRLEELAVRGTLYFPQQGDIEKNLAKIERAVAAEVYEGLDLPPIAVVMPAYSLGPTQPEPKVLVACPVFWAAGREVPDEVVYEVTRILYEAAAEGAFVPYHAVGKGLVPDFITRSFWVTEEERLRNYHPGALKFFEARGIELGTFE